MNRSKIKTVASAAFTAVFLLIIFGAMFVTVLSEKKDVSYYENRRLAVFPSFSIDGVKDGSYFEDVGDYIKDHAAMREKLLAVNALIDLNVLQRPVVNGIYVGDDVLLPYFDEESVDTDAIRAEASVVADRFAERRELVEQMGGRYYFVAVPSQYVCYEDEYPWYLNSRKEYMSVVHGAFMEELAERGVSCIDMAERYEESGRAEYFASRVDHHFGILGAYETYLEILGRYTADTGAVLDVLDKGTFDVEYLPNKYMGSRSRKIFGFWDSTERLGIISPHESVPFKRYDNGVAVAPTVYDLPESESENVLYTTYMGGDVAKTLIDTGRDELPTVLIYGESFTNAVESIAWYSFGKMYSLDLRHSKEGAFEALVSEVKPDLVVCIRDYSVLLMTEDYGH